MRNTFEYVYVYLLDAVGSAVVAETQEAAKLSSTTDASNFRLHDVIVSRDDINCDILRRQSDRYTAVHGITSLT